MFMLSLIQESGAYEQDKSTLELVTLQLLQMIQMKAKLYMCIQYRLPIML